MPVAPQTAEQRLALPRACRDPELHQAVIEARLSHFPKCRENYEQFQAYQRGGISNFLPTILDIESVSRCNYRCTMCEVSTWKNSQRAEDMNFEDFKNLIESQYGLLEIKIQGLGEPFLGKSYIDMIRYARERHLWVRSTTNASILHKDENYKHVIAADICELQVSMDGATKETYEKIRRGGKFDHICKNIQMLNDYGRSVGKNRTRMWTVVQRDNYSELKQMPKFATELGFTRATFSLDLNDFGKKSWKERNDQVDMHREFTLELAEEMIAIGKRNGVEVTFWYLDEKFNTQNPKNLCPWPFERAMISSDMRIIPCCMISNPDVMQLGDARNFTEAWNAKPYQNFRKAHLAGNIPGICKSCYKPEAV